MRCRTKLERLVCPTAAVVLFGALLTAAPASARPDTTASHGGRHAELNDGAAPGHFDVYFVDEDLALRNPDRGTPLDAPLFNVAGVPLDMTWADYTAARGRSLAIVSPGDDPETTVVVALDGLVPGGVYSLYYSTFIPDSRNPDCPNALTDVPVESIFGGWQRPDPSSFTADHRGRAVFIGKADADLIDVFQSNLAVIYHTDGNTYHPLPNRGAFETQGEDCRSSFGVDAMRQLVILQTVNA